MFAYSRHLFVIGLIPTRTLSYHGGRVLSGKPLKLEGRCGFREFREVAIQSIHRTSVGLWLCKHFHYLVAFVTF